MAKTQKQETKHRLFIEVYVEDQTGRLTVADILDKDEKLVGRGFAVRNPIDQENRWLGEALALERAMADYQRKLRKERQALQYGRK